MSWDMKTGNGTKRGACVLCKNDSTVDQELVSVCVNGSSLCYCQPCSEKPEVKRHKQGD